MCANPTCRICTHFHARGFLFAFNFFTSLGATTVTQRWRVNPWRMRRQSKIKKLYIPTFCTPQQVRNRYSPSESVLLRVWIQATEVEFPGWLGTSTVCLARAVAAWHARRCLACGLSSYTPMGMLPVPLDSMLSVLAGCYAATQFTLIIHLNHPLT